MGTYLLWGDGSIYLLGGWVEIFGRDEYPIPPGFAPLCANYILYKYVLKVCQLYILEVCQLDTKYVCFGSEPPRY